MATNLNTITPPMTEEEKAKSLGATISFLMDCTKADFGSKNENFYQFVSFLAGRANIQFEYLIVDDSYTIKYWRPSYMVKVGSAAK